MYRKKNRQLQKERVTISLEALVPENHLLRIIDKAIDFNFIYEEVENLYSEKGFIRLPKPCRTFRLSEKIMSAGLSDIFERIFKKILEEAQKSGYVDASAIFIDSTHIKASANKQKSYAYVKVFTNFMKNWI